GRKEEGGVGREGSGRGGRGFLGGGGGKGCARRNRAGDVRDSAAPAGARLHAQQDRELRPLDRRNGQDPGRDAGGVREVTEGHSGARVKRANPESRQRWLTMTYTLPALA